MQARYYDPVIGRFYSNDPDGSDRADINVQKAANGVSASPFNPPTGKHV